MKKVYLPMGVDIIHHGHINIIKKASELGEVIIGLQTDSVISSYKRFPLLDYEQRKMIISEIVGVSDVVCQNSIYGIERILELKPDYYVHGDDWIHDSHSKDREEVMKALATYGGSLVEFPYTVGVSVNMLDEKLHEIEKNPAIRCWKLRKLLESKALLRFMEAHDGLSGLIVEKVRYETKDGVRTFDGLWSSSLCDSTIMGKPDIELVDLTSRIHRVNEIMEVTTKPIIFDCDTGGKTEHFVYKVKSLERLGVSAVIIEDKTGVKKNSLLGSMGNQTQDSIEGFCEKIRAGKKAQIGNDFMIIARIESLILNKGIEDAVLRAEAYIEAGADAIMIHSCSDSPEEILKFCDIYKEFKNKKPLVAVPSSYHVITEEELEKAGVNIVIYANQLIRAAYPSMLHTARSILKYKRSYEIEDRILSISEVLQLIPEEV